MSLVIQWYAASINDLFNIVKVIFPSTHVVYEGFKETKYNIVENEPVRPVLTYSTSKIQNEADIMSSGKDYIILRLGSVYGYSTDTMRIGIMPNLFSKMVSQNQNIKLFSGGIQYKSLVNLIDVARCFKFMAESEIKNETFHLVNEQATVKEVAEYIVEKTNSSSKIIFQPKEEVFGDYDEIRVRFANTEKAKRLLGYTVNYSTFEVIDEVINS